ncbi:MAG: alpha-1,6-mannosyltransferase [Vezdaea aestivalis]|nr:MAG: alpha-1,6-mannosyltransferase [Vezdaea aestivalis]
MSLSRSPSPQRGGGWASPGLTDNISSGRSSPVRAYTNVNGGANNVAWASAKARSAQVNGHQGFSTKNAGWFGRHARSISSSLPRFGSGGGRKSYGDREKLNRGRWGPSGGGIFRRFQTLCGGIFRRMKLRLLLVLAILVLWALFYITPLHRVYRKASFLGGGSRFVIILAANQGGGVMEWKGPREWAIERDSIRNKKHYAEKWGYELEIVDMSTKKRYAHEWRESWEKVDTIRTTLRKYPNVEWVWWMDLNTFIMEPSYSLQSHIFQDLALSTYRNISVYNPLNIPAITASQLDPISLSPTGDNNPQSINLIIPQDCGGFNLGSFFVRRSTWTDRLLDIWWDPVMYEQRHMQWEHKEQDALEYLYSVQPWIRPHVAFIPQRKVNSFPPGACGDKGDDPRIHYNQLDRDFVVNMAGCEWGRDCWGEMYNYRELSHTLNSNMWENFKDWFNNMVRDALRREQKKGA